MKYIILIDENGKQTNLTVDAPNSKQAHTIARKTAPKGATVRAYPRTIDERGNIDAYAVLRGALQVAKKSAEKTEGATATQRNMINELTNANAKASAPEAEALGAGYIIELTAKLSADSQEYLGYAYKGILESINSGEDIPEQYHNAYISINHYAMKLRSATVREVSTEYIQTNGGALVSISQYLARIIKNGERYTPTDSGTMDTETANKLGAVLSACAVTLTPRQKEITILAARGYSQRQIADKLKIKSVSTINEHLTHIRKKCLDYITENAPEFLILINSYQVNVTENATKLKNRRNKHNAEYYREYRARKKALKN